MARLPTEERPFEPFQNRERTMGGIWQGGMGDAQRGADAAGGRYLGARGYMENALGMYGDLMEDPSKSVAQQQLKAGMEANLANQIQAQSAARGGNMAGAQQLASGQAAGLGTQMNQQAAQLRAQEYQAALGGYSGVAGQMAGMDLQQQMGLGQLGLGYGQMGFDYELGLRQAMEQEKENRWQRGMGLAEQISSGLGGIIGGAMMSDRDAKRDIRPAGVEMDRALARAEAESGIADALGRMPGPYAYEYKPGMGPPGQRVGLMANDMQREPALAPMVQSTPLGLMVDTGQAAGTALAASAQQQREIEKLKAEKERQERELRALMAAQESGTGKAGVGLGALLGKIGG